MFNLIQYRRTFIRTTRIMFLVCTMALLLASVSVKAQDTIKIGVLHSLSGTMSISEVTVKDSTLMAIDEINAAGGVMGKKLEPIVEDGASDWPTFAEKASKLLLEDKVAVVAGFASASSA